MPEKKLLVGLCIMLTLTLVVWVRLPNSIEVLMVLAQVVLDVRRCIPSELTLVRPRRKCVPLGLQSCRLSVSPTNWSLGRTGRLPFIRLQLQSIEVSRALWPTVRPTVRCMLPPRNIGSLASTGKAQRRVFPALLTIRPGPCPSRVMAPRLIPPTMLIRLAIRVPICVVLLVTVTSLVSVKRVWLGP